MKRRLLPLLCVLLAAPAAVFARSSEDKPSRNPGTVRLLCLAPNLPSKLIRTPSGSFVGVPRDFGETAPTSVFHKSGEDYKPVSSFCVGKLTTPLSLGSSKKDNGVSGGFYFPTPKKVAPAAPSAPAPAGANAKKGAPAPGYTEQTYDWHVLAKIPEADGKDHLLCLFSENGAGKWYPPAMLDVDISSSAFAADRCMMLNLSGRPVWVQLGEGSAPVALAGKGGRALPAFPANGAEMRVKVLTQNKDGSPAPVFNRMQKVPVKARGILVVYEAHPSEGLPVCVKFIEMECAETKPVETAVADGRRN